MAFLSLSASQYLCRVQSGDFAILNRQQIPQLGDWVVIHQGKTYRLKKYVSGLRDVVGVITPLVAYGQAARNHIYTG